MPPRETNVARRMEVGPDNRTDAAKKEANHRHCATTFKAYVDKATNFSKQKELIEVQKKDHDRVEGLG